jgi:hypothetical protein
MAMEETMEKKEVSGFILPKKKISIKPNFTNPGWIKNSKHVAFFKMEGTFDRYGVPMKRNGGLVNIFTDAEKEYLERVTGLNLSVYNDDYWAKKTIKLNRNGLTLDLSDPEDYIQYCLARANTEFIAPSIKDKNNRATYRYYIEDAEEAQVIKSQRASNIKDGMRYYIQELEGKRDKLIDFLRVYGQLTNNVSLSRVNKDAKLDFLQNKVEALVEDNPKVFTSIVNDPAFNSMLLIAQAVNYGIILKNGTTYSLAETGEPIGKTYSETAKALTMERNQDLRLLIEQRVENAAE